MKDQLFKHREDNGNILMSKYPLAIKWLGAFEKAESFGDHPGKDYKRTVGIDAAVEAVRPRIHRILPVVILLN